MDEQGINWIRLSILLNGYQKIILKQSTRLNVQTENSHSRNTSVKDIFEWQPMRTTKQLYLQQMKRES